MFLPGHFGLIFDGDKGVVVLHQFFDFYLFSEGLHGARLPCFWSQSLVRGVNFTYFRSCDPSTRSSRY